MFTWVQGARKEPKVLQWMVGATPLNLTGATLSGTVRRNGVATAITGTLTVLDPATGVFRWEFSEDDVAVAGDHRVEFVATYASGPSPAVTDTIDWRVTPRLADLD